MWLSPLLLVIVGVATSAALGVERMRVQNMETLTVDPAVAPVFSWVPTSEGRDAQTTAYRVWVRFAADQQQIWDSGRVYGSDFRCTYAGPALPAASRLEWGVQWWSQTGDASPILWAPFHTGLQDWGNSSWIGGNAKLLRREFTISSPQQTTIFISGLGLFQLYVNGLRIDSGVLSGTWTTYNERVHYFTYDITNVLKVGTNAIGVMLGRGWRNLDSYPVLYDGSPCDKNERLLRAVVVAGGNTILSTDSTWQATVNSPILSDSIYNGETYDARLEQPGWDQPGFVPAPTAGWAAANVISCLNPIMSPVPFTDISVEVQRRPVSIHKLSSDCPDGVFGGMVGENTNLTLTCMPGTGTISNILFASYGTPTGTCASYKDGSCKAADSLQLVKQLCEGKTSCVIPATNDFFKGDPCLDVVKSLAVAANGCTPTSQGDVVVDFGENLSGWIKLFVRGRAGTTVTLRHAEVLQHPPYGPVNGDIYVGNLRSAQATEVYTLRGSADGEIFEPHFTYHGFQFVKISGYPGELTADNITQIHFRTLNRVAATFNSSSPVLNAIQDHALKGQGSNMMSLPTDCDQRDERLGWMGDADLSADSFALNYDYVAFQDAYLANMIDAQAGDGSLPDVVPFVRYGGRPADVSWSAALPQNIYVRYKINGDLTPAQTHWDSLLKYFGNLAAQYAAAGSDFTKWHTPYGDWVPAGPGVSPQLCTAFTYIVNSQQMAELATALNRSSDAQAFSSLATRLRAAFNTAFYHADRKCWDNCGQSSYAMALVAGVADASLAQTAMAALINDVVSTHSNHVTVGIIGAKALFGILQSAGHVQVGVDLAEQTTSPSWGYMIYNDLEPATSNLWELWDSPTQGPGMNSRNHHMFSSISAFIVTAAGGIDGEFCHRSLTLRPAQAFGVSWARTTLDTACGTVALSYTRAGTQQCAKLPEGRSSVRPILPVVADAVLSCGPQGGVITAVDFASWGLPDGTCGGFRANATCDVDVSAQVRRQCLGRSKCALSSSAEAWPTARCAGPSRLFAQVTCSGAHAVHTQLAVPVAAPRTRVLLPLFSAAPAAVRVLDGETEIYAAGVFTRTAGVESVAVEGGNVVVSVGSGSYELRLLSA